MSSMRLAFIVAASVVLSLGCNRQHSTPQQQPPATGKSVGLAKSSIPVQAGGLDFVGSDQISGRPQHTVALQKNKDAVAAGWAIDLDADTLASGVDVAIDGVPYAAEYGTARPDVADSFKRPAYLNSGFRYVIPTGQLSAGTYILSVRIIGADKRTYRETTPLTIKVK